jgi:sporulation transcriptional regulator SpoIIID
MFGGISRMKQYIEERAVEIAQYIIEQNATVRTTAKKFGISKSTVHKDLTDRLEKINPQLASQARQVLEVNKAERHIRGGMATKEKYLHLSSSFGTQSEDRFM